MATSTIQSRACAGLARGTYIFCLPGSPGACKDAWNDILRWQLDNRHRPCNFVEIMPRLEEHRRGALSQERLRDLGPRDDEELARGCGVEQRPRQLPAQRVRPPAEACALHAIAAILAPARHRQIALGDCPLERKSPMLTGQGWQTAQDHAKTRAERLDLALSDRRQGWSEGRYRAKQRLAPAAQVASGDGRTKSANR